MSNGRARGCEAYQDIVGCLVGWQMGVCVCYVLSPWSLDLAPPSFLAQTGGLM